MNKKEIVRDSPLAIPTLLLSFLVNCLWLLNIYLTLVNKYEILIGVLISSVLAYLSFTPLHEASHGNVAGKFKQFRILENTIGRTSAFILFIPYIAFKILHLQHHSYTNDPEKDPDYWVATRNPVLLLIKCVTIKISYYYHILFKPTKAVERTRVSVVLCLCFYIALIILSFYFDIGKDIILLWPLSAVIALSFLALFFDWLPHTPHRDRGRYVDTAIYDFKLLTLPMLWQNYHLMHHLYPRIPFYRYRNAFILFEEELDERKSKIIK